MHCAECRGHDHVKDSCRVSVSLSRCQSFLINIHKYNMALYEAYIGLSLQNLAYVQA